MVASSFLVPSFVPSLHGRDIRTRWIALDWQTLFAQHFSAPNRPSHRSQVRRYFPYGETGDTEKGVVQTEQKSLAKSDSQ